jgi:thiol-disulfide isomerase/thioredoxin
MKRTFLMLAIVLSSVVAVAQGVNFQELTFEQALAKAKAENKLVFIDSYTDWCGPCRLMANEIFPMKEMGDYFNPKFVSIKSNAEKGEDGPAVKQKFGIKAYPTFVILDGDGNLIHMFAGGVLGLGFIDKVEDSFNPDKALGQLQKRYNSGERDKKLVANYIKAIMGTYTIDVTSMVNEFTNSLPKEELICEECLFLFDDLAQLGSEREKFLTGNLEKFRSEVGREKIDIVLKKKYEAYYAGILGRQRAANASDIGQTNSQLAQLDLEKADILPVYQAALSVFMSKNGGQELFKLIKDTAPKVEKNEMDRLLYFTIPAISEALSKEQTDELVTMVNNDSAREKIVKALERLKK